MKLGQIATIAYLITSLTRQDENGNVVQGMNKNDAVHSESIWNKLGLNVGYEGGMDDSIETLELSMAEKMWIITRINEVFDARLMPRQLARYALEILNW